MRLSLIILCLTLVVGCKDDDPNNWGAIPESFIFIVLDQDGQPVITSDKQDIQTSYDDANGKRTVFTDCKEAGCTQIRPFDQNPPAPYYFITYNAAFLSGNSGIRNFYIKIDNDVDTIYLEIQKLPKVDPVSHVGYKYVSVKFNGEEAVKKEDAMPWYYVLKR